MSSPSNHEPQPRPGTQAPAHVQNAITLSISQEFEIERFNRAIDATADADELRAVAKQLMRAWQTQKAASGWLISQQLSR